MVILILWVQSSFVISQYCVYCIIFDRLFLTCNISSSYKGWVEEVIIHSCQFILFSYRTRDTIWATPRKVWSAHVSELPISITFDCYCSNDLNSLQHCFTVKILVNQHGALHLLLCLYSYKKNHHQLPSDSYWRPYPSTIEQVYQ